MSSYTSVLAISEYTRKWVRDRWDVDAAVLYPPADRLEVTSSKEPLVLSVGRFVSSGLVKCQLELSQAFAGWAPAGWRYATAGAAGTTEASYVDAVRRAAAGAAIDVLPNANRDALLGLFGKARIFWHAAGYANKRGEPELNEHFGITIVEAMSAGCVPVAFDAGGPSEIIEHGINGFVWKTLDDLRSYTERLMVDDALWRTMSAAARLRAAGFSRQTFVEKYLRHLDLHDECADGSAAPHLARHQPSQAGR
jgi:glycosyltransferase involved in cell wall biosynthesis